MAKALTVLAVKNAKPKTVRWEKPDGIVPGLYLVVQPSGAKSWAVRYRRGKSKKLTLGPYPALELADARDAARAALQTVAKGGDPASQKRAAKQVAATGSNLFENVAEEFLKRHRTRKGEKPRSLPEIERMLRHDVIPAWKGRLIQDITRRDVIELLDGLTDRGIEAMANRIFSVVRLMFNWALSRDIVTASPCVNVRPPAEETTRDRVLSHDEIRAFWKATGKADYPFGSLFRLLLVTGQRLSEVAGMSWSELDLDKRIWSLPKERVKNKRDHDVPLSDAAIDIISSLPKIAGTRKLLFTTTGDTPVSGFSRAKRNLDKTMPGVSGWTLHDLRRTVATELQKLKIPPHVTEAVLNHKSGVISGIAAVYARHDYADEKRSALDAWGRRLDLVERGQAADNVVELHAAGA